MQQLEFIQGYQLTCHLKWLEKTCFFILVIQMPLLPGHHVKTKLLTVSLHNSFPVVWVVSASVQIGRKVHLSWLPSYFYSFCVIFTLHHSKFVGEITKSEWSFLHIFHHLTISSLFSLSLFPLLSLSQIPVNTYDHNTAVVLLPCSNASEEGNEEDDDSDSYEQRRRRTKLSP